MPEVSGKIVFKVDPISESILMDSGKCISSENITEILRLCGVNLAEVQLEGETNVDFDTHSLSLQLDREYNLESKPSRKADYIVAEVEGEQWRGFSKILVDSNSPIEIYSKTDDEYGTSFLFSKTSDGKKLSTYWEESDYDEEEMEEYGLEPNPGLDNWTNTLPKSVQALFDC